MNDRGPGTPLPADGWVRELADADRRREERTRGAREHVRRRKEEFASAAARMMGRLRDLFETAATSFNQASPSAPVTVTSLKGSGFTVTRHERRLTVMKTADWNVAFSFSSPPKLDHVALLSRLEGDGLGWRLCRK